MELHEDWTDECLKGFPVNTEWKKLKEKKLVMPLISLLSLMNLEPAQIKLRNALSLTTHYRLPVANISRQLYCQFYFKKAQGELGSKITHLP